MFDLSDEIAYDGLMIDATDPALAVAFEAPYPTLPRASESTLSHRPPMSTGSRPRAPSSTASSPTSARLASTSRR
jgi:hypothetical protein